MKRMNFFLKKWNWLSLVILNIFFLNPSLALEAADEIFPLGRSMSYNIYLSGAEEKLVFLENVDVLGFEDIGGKSFLVVQLHGFSLQPAKGYILFDKIAAILPNINPRLKNVDGTAIHF